mgnify:CR=1 FL=1
MSILSENRRGTLLKPEVKQEPENIFAGERYAEPTIYDGIERALKNNSLTYNAIDFAQEHYDSINDDIEFKRDNKFTKDIALKKLKELQVPEEYHRFVLGKSRNEEQFNNAVKYVNKQVENQAYLDDMGIAGVGVELLAGLTDIPLYAFTGGTALGVKTSMFAGKTLAKSALVGGVSGLAFEAGIDALGDKERDAVDYMVGGVFGAGVGALLKGGQDFVVDRAKKKIEKTIKVDELVKKLDGIEDEATRNKIAGEHIQSVAKDIQENKYLMNLNMIKDDVEEGTTSAKVLDYLRTDLAHLTQTSPSEILSSIGKTTFFDPRLQKNLDDVSYIDELRSQVHEQMDATILDTMNPITRDLEDNILGKWYKIDRYSNSNDIVSDIAGEMQQAKQLQSYNMDKFNKDDILNKAKQRIINLVPDEDKLKIKDLDKYATKVANDIYNATSKLSNDMYTVLEKAGMKEFANGNIPRTDNYFPIHYDKNIAGYLAQNNMNKSHLTGMLKGAMVSKFSRDGIEVADELLDLVASSVSHRLYTLSDKFSGESNTIDGVLRELLDNSKLPKEVSDLLGYTDRVIKDATNKGTEKVASGAKYRSPFDYSYKHTARDTKGKDVELSFGDITSKKYFENMSQYSKKMSGQLALEKMKVKLHRKEIAFKYEDVKQDLDDTLVAVRESVRSGDTSLLAPQWKILNEKYGEKANRVIDFVKTKEESLRLLAKDIHGSLKTDGFKNATKKEKELYNQEFVKRYGERLPETFSSDFPKLLDNILHNEFDEVVDLSTKKNITDVRNSIYEELRESGASQSKISSELARFDEIINNYSNVPTAIDPNGYTQSLTRSARNISISRLLGQVGFAMAFELGGVVWNNGIRNTLEFSSFRGLHKQLKTGKIDSKLAQEIQTHFGLGNQLTKHLSSEQYGSDINIIDEKSYMDGNKLKKLIDGLEKTTEKFADVTMLVSGMHSFTANLEMITAKGIISDISGLSGKKLNKKWLNKFKEMGISEDTAMKIKSQIDRFATTEEKKWSNGHRVTALNFDNWDDEELKGLFIRAIRRYSHSVVQKQTFGDKIALGYGDSLVSNTAGFKVLMDLKGYMMTAYNKQLGKMIEKRDWDALGNMMTVFAVGSTAVAFKEYINNYGTDNLDKAMQLENIASKSIGMMPQTSFVPLLTDIVSGAFYGKPVFGEQRYGGATQELISTIPTMDLLNKLYTITSIPLRTVREEAGDETAKSMTSKDVGSIFGVLPLGNTYGVKTLQNLLKEEASDRTNDNEIDRIYKELSNE